MKLTQLLIRIGILAPAPPAKADAAASGPEVAAEPQAGVAETPARWPAEPPGASAETQARAEEPPGASAETQARAEETRAASAKTGAKPQAGTAKPQAAPAKPAEPVAAAVPPRTLTLEELRQQARAVRHELLKTDLGLGATLEDVYREAHLEPTHETLEELGRFLREKGIQDPAAARAELILLLAERKLPLEEILADAQRRDAALDRYEERLVARVGAWQSQVRAQCGELRRQAQDLLAQAERLESQGAQIERQLTEWRKRKHAAEDELERLAELLVSPPG